MMDHFSPSVPTDPYFVTFSAKVYAVVRKVVVYSMFGLSSVSGIGVGSSPGLIYSGLVWIHAGSDSSQDKVLGFSIGSELFLEDFTGPAGPSQSSSRPLG